MFIRVLILIVFTMLKQYNTVVSAKGRRRRVLYLAGTSAIALGPFSFARTLC